MADDFGIDPSLFSLGGAYDQGFSLPSGDFSLYGAPNQGFNIPTQGFNFGGGGFDFGSMLGGYDPSAYAAPPQINANMPQLPQQGAQTPQQPGGLFGISPQNLALGAGVGMTGLGLIGALQKMLGGEPLTTQRTTPAGATPAEAAALQAAMQNTQQAGGLYNTLIQQLMGGQLGLSPEMNALVDASFQNTINKVVEQSIEGARQRGFAGGADLLQGAAGPVYARLAAELPGQMAQARLNTAFQVPQIGAQLAGGQAQVGAQQGALAADQARYRPITTQQTGPSSTLLDAMQPLAQTAGGLGGLLGGLALYNSQIKSLSGGY